MYAIRSYYGIANSRTEIQDERSIQAVLEEKTTALMSISGVVGTAVGEHAGKPCIKVFVARRTPELLEQVPSMLEGYPVAVQEVGEFRSRESGQT